MIKRLTQLVLATSLVLSISSPAYALQAEDTQIDSSVFTYDQMRINLEILQMAGEVANVDHLSKYYPDDSAMMNSFKEYFNPLMILSMTCSEWGGHARFDYSWTPAIATRDIAKAGLQPWQIRVKEVCSEYYLANGIILGESGKTYWGPLQINKSYFPQGVSEYACGNVPTDYYSWQDQVEWYVHTYGRYIQRTAYSDYTFRNEYEVMANCAIMANTGPSYISSKTLYQSKPWYPWLSDTSSIMRWARDITSDNSLAIIRASAKKFYDEKIASVKDGSISDYPGNVQCNRAEANRMIAEMGLDASNYVQPQYVDIAFLLNPTQPNEKLVHPIMSVWSYMVLEMLYTSGKEAS